MKTKQSAFSAELSKTLLKSSLLGVLFSIICVGTSQADTFKMTCRAEGYKLTTGQNTVEDILPPYTITLLKKDNRVIKSPFKKDENTLIQKRDGRDFIEGSDYQNHRWTMTETSTKHEGETLWEVTGHMVYNFKTSFYDPYSNTTIIVDPKSPAGMGSYVTITGDYMCTTWEACDDKSMCSVS